MPHGLQNHQPDALRAALKDACDLLEGWVLSKCPARYRGEHMRHIQGLRSVGQPQQVNGALMVTGVLVTWHRVADGLPTDARTVQIYIPGEAPPEDEVTTLGWYQPEEGQWYDLGGDPLGNAEVEWWAEQTPAPQKREG